MASTILFLVLPLVCVFALWIRIELAEFEQQQTRQALRQDNSVPRRR